MNKPIIILKNDTLFIDGQQFDGFALFATRDDGNGHIYSVNYLNGQFSRESVKVTVDYMIKAVLVFEDKMKGV